MMRDYVFQLKRPIKEKNITHHMIVEKAHTPAQAYQMIKKSLKPKDRAKVTPYYEVSKAGGWMDIQNITI